MFKAIDRRKKVIERRQKAQEKAKGVMAGKGLRPKSKKSGGDGDETEDDERCTGGEHCRCAEVRSGNPVGTDSNSHSRKTDNLTYANNDNPDEPPQQFDVRANLDECSIIDDSSIIGDDTSIGDDQGPGHSTSRIKETPPMPDVDTFDLDHTRDSNVNSERRGATVHTTT